MEQVDRRVFWDSIPHVLTQLPPLRMVINLLLSSTASFCPIPSLGNQYLFHTKQGLTCFALTTNSSIILFITRKMIIIKKKK